MTAIERTAWPVIGRPGQQELEEEYTLTQAEIRFVRGRFRREGRNKKYLVQADYESSCYRMAILLKCFQRLHYFPALSAVPDTVAAHIARQMKIPSRTPRTCGQRMLHRHKSDIMKHLGIKPWLEGGRETARKVAEESAFLHNYPADIINHVMEMLLQTAYELPPYGQITRLVREIRHAANQQIFDRVTATLSDKSRQNFDLLITGKSRTSWFRLKERAKSTTVTHFRSLLEQHDWLMSIGHYRDCIRDITDIKRRHFVGEAMSLDASDMRDITENKRYALTALLIDAMQRQAKDDMITMLIKTMGRIEVKAQEKLQELREKYREKTGELLVVLSDIVTALGKKATKKGLRQIRQILADHGGRETVMHECDEAIGMHNEDHLPMMWPSFRSSRKNLFSMLRVLNIQSSTQNSQLIAAMKFIMQYQNTRTDLLPSTINISFAPRKWQKLITVTQGKNKFYSKKYLEVCVFTCLAGELRAADVYVEGSGSWPDFRAELTEWKDCIPLVDEHCKNTGIPSTGKEAGVFLKDLLETRSREIDQRYPDIDEFVIQENGRPLLKKRKRAAIEEEDLQLVMMIKSRMPKRNLIDILVNIEHHAQWTSPFGPVSGSDAKIENPAERYILMTFAYGTGMGPKQTAQHMRHQISPHMLSWANQRHSTLQMQNKAMVKLINLFRRLGITKCWGDGTRAIADGTLRKIRAENLTAEHHIRYGSTGGIAYHHVADNYIALFSTFIPCGVWEAVEIIEGLLRNESDIQPKIIHADTQGQSSVVFALAWLFGIKLMPRIRNWKDLKFYRPSKKTRYRHIDSLFSEAINWQLIETHWQDIMQVVISIRQGKISSSALLKKFGSYSKQNRLCLAMRELGNVIRTIFLLEYIGDADVREEITAQTNKVESYNEFSGWISFGNRHAIVASNDPEEHEKAVKYNDIIANAVMLQNAIDMSVVVKGLVAEGYPVKRTAMRLTSPYLTDHLNRFGEFVVDMGIVTEDIQSVIDLPELE